MLHVPLRHAEVTPMPDGSARIDGLTLDEVVAALEADDSLLVVRNDGADLAGLSVRETEILRYIASGYSNEALAAAMFLSVNTVKSHIRSAYRKVGAVSRSQAVGWAMRHGLTEPPTCGPHN